VVCNSVNIRKYQEELSFLFVFVFVFDFDFVFALLLLWCFISPIDGYLFFPAFMRIFL